MSLTTPAAAYNLSEFDEWLPAEAPRPETAPLIAPSEIVTGQRNISLFRIGRVLHARGLSGGAIRAALHAENAAKCGPALPVAEVDDLATHVMAQPDRADFTGAIDDDVILPEDETPPSPRRTRFLGAAEVMIQPAPAEVVEGIAWAGCLTVQVAESGAGKTFFLLDLSAAVSAGLTFHGRDVARGSVAYASFEGDALGTRLRALREAKGARLEHVQILRTTDTLSPAVARDGTETPSKGEVELALDLTLLADDLAAAGQPPIRLLVIDTVRASLAGNEDASEDVAAYLRVVRRLMAHIPHAAAILAHHAGWQDGDTKRKRERGSSAWRGNCDATLYLEAGDYDRDRGEARLILRALKVRDAELPPPLHLIRRRVELAESAADDLRRGPATSCVIDTDPATREDREAADLTRLEADARDFDLHVLRAILTRPDMATSRDAVRILVGKRKTEVCASMDRLIRAGWLLTARQREPFIVTDAGRQAAEVAHS